MTPVTEGAVEFVRGVRLRIVPIDGVVGAWDPMFAYVLSVLDVRLVEWMVLIGVVLVGEGHHVMGVAFVFGQGRPSFGLQSVVAPRQPFYGDFVMVDATWPSQKGFGGDDLGHETAHA